MAAYKERHSRGITIKKIWVLGMFSKKKVMKWQKGSKQHPLTWVIYADVVRRKLCPREREPISLKNRYWREQKLGRELQN